MTTNETNGRLDALRGWLNYQKKKGGTLVYIEELDAIMGWEADVLGTIECKKAEDIVPIN